MTRIGKRVEEKIRRDGKVSWEPIRCECGGTFYYSETLEAICNKCGAVIYA